MQRDYNSLAVGKHIGLFIIAAFFSLLLCDKEMVEGFEGVVE